MECPKCKAVNPDGKKFCGDCGVSLDAIDEEFRRRVQAIFREQLRDQKMVEIDTADAVIVRLKTWAKPFLYATAVMAGVLGVLGFRSLRDFHEALKNAQQEGVATLRQQAASESKSLAQEVESIRATYRKVGDQQELIQKLKDTETQLASIQQASHRLKERYEVASTELAQQSGGDGQSPQVSKRIGMTLGESARAREAARYFAVGSTGTEVGQIQARLRELGCYRGEVSGSYDQATKLAVSRFNQARGELDSGIVDPPTWTALFAKTTAGHCR